MQDNGESKIKICMLSSVPVTLRNFYGALIRQLKDCDFEVILVSSDVLELSKLGDELACEVFATSILRQISPINDVVSIYRLFRYLSEHKCDIVHAHTPKGGLIGMIASWLAFTPNRIYTIHGLVLETTTGLKRKLLWFAEWLACKFSTWVLAVSPSLRQRIIDEGICPARKIQVFGHGSACGIDIKKFTRSERFSAFRDQIRSGYNIPQDAIVIGFLGRIVPDKGIETLVRAFEKLQEKNVKCYLLLVGSFETVRGTLNDTTIQIIEGNPYILCNREFVSDVLPFYAAMDILTLPSRREGFGLTLIEASALELPVIATRVTGCVDAVVDVETGLLVEVDNVEQLANAMLKLAKDYELRKSMGRKGYDRVRMYFDSRDLICSHIKLYNKVLRTQSVS